MFPIQKKIIHTIKRDGAELAYVIKLTSWYSCPSRGCKTKLPSLKMVSAETIVVKTSTKRSNLCLRAVIKLFPKVTFYFFHIVAASNTASNPVILDDGKCKNNNHLQCLKFTEFVFQTVVHCTTCR